MEHLSVSQIIDVVEIHQQSSQISGQSPRYGRQSVAVEPELLEVDESEHGARVDPLDEIVVEHEYRERLKTTKSR